MRVDFTYAISEYHSKTGLEHVLKTGMTGWKNISLARSDIAPLELNSPDYLPDLGLRLIMRQYEHHLMEIMGTSFPDALSENPWASFSIILQVVTNRTASPFIPGWNRTNQEASRSWNLIPWRKSSES